MTRNAPSTLAAVCSSATLGTLDAELWLEPHALKRWRRFRHRRDRDGFLVARVLTAILWGRLRGRDPDTCCFQQTCSECGGPHGRPRIVGETELWPSWSHSGDLVAAIVGPAPVAIDIETNTHAIPVDITGPGTAAERQERWSLAECWTKAGYTDLGSALDHIRRGTTPPCPLPNTCTVTITHSRGYRNPDPTNHPKLRGSRLAGLSCCPATLRPTSRTSSQIPDIG